MPEIGQTERLQPSLLDRLTDLHPENREEPAEDRIIDMRRLREIIQRDLSWLLNTTNIADMLDATAYPNAANSVINYGIPEVTAAYAGARGAERIRASIVDAVRKYEPRIAADSIDVQVQKSETVSVVSFDIIADMWAQPIPMELYLRSQVDLGTGVLKLERVG